MVKRMIFGTILLTIAYYPIAAPVRRNAEMFQPGQNKVRDILPRWEGFIGFETLGNNPVGQQFLNAGIYFLFLSIIQYFC